MGTPLSKHKKYDPKHRQLRAAGVPKKALRNTLVLSSIAVAATGSTVATGMFGDGAAAKRDVAPMAADLGSVAPLSAQEIAERRGDDEPSRSDRRSDLDRTKQAELTAAASTPTGNAVIETEDATDDDPRGVARALLSEFGFGSDQFGCLDSLWTKESGWNPSADNPSSSAYGIPQALPGSKMSSAGADWATNPATQIRWGLGYIQDRYGTPCSAWGHSQSHNWY
ncbi:MULTISPECIES: lytic transglycosylase domain-containing protein [unclassified Nocardioides]|uniref:lytic transglycosylase domain-containing protein n=1 Tax=unclassified Nocardioides TaxID=2615069 RepID=UPI000A8160AD|nr:MULTISPECIES: lytic transglycosylase domain-containing protein [unclassified Nocardioides]